jgi:hypothetical protein
VREQWFKIFSAVSMSVPRSKIRCKAAAKIVVREILDSAGIHLIFTAPEDGLRMAPQKIHTEVAEFYLAFLRASAAMGIGQRRRGTHARSIVSQKRAQ